MSPLSDDDLNELVNGQHEAAPIAEELLLAREALREVRAKQLAWAGGRWVAIVRPGRPSEEWVPVRPDLAAYLDGLAAAAPSTPGATPDA